MDYENKREVDNSVSVGVEMRRMIVSGLCVGLQYRA